jgi:hypothetical protein
MANGSMTAWNNTNSTWVTVCPAGTIVKGVWTHVTFSYDGTTMRGYKNGSLCGSAAYAYNDISTHSLTIGSWYSPSAIYDYVGGIEEVKFFNSGLLATQAAQEYNTTASVMTTPVSTWEFDEGTGTTAADSTGNGHTGTFTGPVWTTGVGTTGSSVLFWGAGSVVTIPSSNSYSYGNNAAFSIEGWIRPYILRDYGAFVSKVVTGRTGAAYTYMTATMANGAVWAYNTVTPVWTLICPAGTVTTGRWQHLAFTYDGTTMRGYKNGTLCGSAAFSYTDTEAHTVTIGSWYSPSTVYDFYGLIDKVSMYDYVRSASEISGDYSSVTQASTWRWRTPFTIANSTGQTLTDHQVRLSFSTSIEGLYGKMNEDCSDLRITAADGVTPLSYWIETGTNGCNTPTTYVWVKIPSLPTSGTTVYAYWGNPSVSSSTQSGSSTFDFFDDFSGAALNARWLATGTGSLSNGIFTMTSGAFYTNAAQLASVQNRVVEMRVAYGTPVHYSGLALSNNPSILGSNAGAARMAMALTNVSSSNALMAFAGDGNVANYNLVLNGLQYNPGNAYSVLGIGYTSNALYYFNNRTATNSYATANFYSPYFVLGYFAITAGNVNNTDASVDWLIARKLYLPEPFATAGSEQSGSWTGL